MVCVRVTAGARNGRNEQITRTLVSVPSFDQRAALGDSSGQVWWASWPTDSHCFPLFMLNWLNWDQHNQTDMKQSFVFFCCCFVYVCHFSNLDERVSHKTKFPLPPCINAGFILHPFAFVPSLCFLDLDTPVLTVHQTISDVRGSYYQEKTVFLRCTVNSNPPARFIWKRGNMLIEQSKDNGVDIYEPLYTQVHRDMRIHTHTHTFICSVFCAETRWEGDEELENSFWHEYINVFIAKIVFGKPNRAIIPWQKFSWIDCYKAKNSISDQLLIFFLLFDFQHFILSPLGDAKINHTFTSIQTNGSAWKPFAHFIIHQAASPLAS